MKKVKSACVFLLALAKVIELYYFPKKRGGEKRGGRA